jgi:hypothetical protein
MPLMTECQLAPATPRPCSVSFWDPSSGARLEAHVPEERPDLWHGYVAGVIRAYQRYGVEGALDLDSFANGASTSLFFVATNASGDVIAGLRVHGPLVMPDDAHAISEFDIDRAAQASVRRMIANRLNFGVLEVKGVWVGDSAVRRAELSATMARCFLHAMTLSGAQFAFCTAGAHAVKRWESSGARTTNSVRPVPYPDERYQTVIMWWDKERLSGADPAQLRRYRTEAALLSELPDNDVALARPMSTYQ